MIAKKETCVIGSNISSNQAMINSLKRSDDSKNYLKNWGLLIGILKELILCVLLIFITFSFATAQKALKENISCKQALSLIEVNRSNESFVILDVRTPEEFKQGHLENAILIDYKSENFENEIQKLNPDNFYLIYCKRGGRSAKAISVLKKFNFNNIFHLYEGIDKWQELDYKIVIE